MAKNANGNGSIRKKNGRFEGRYTIGFDATGKQIQKSLYGATKTEVQQKLRKTLGAVAKREFATALFFHKSIAKSMKFVSFFRLIVHSKRAAQHFAWPVS